MMESRCAGNRPQLWALRRSRPTSISVRAPDVGCAWQIGDTPKDAECAASAGARCLAVASGSFDRPALEHANPNWVVSSLEDT